MGPPADEDTQTRFLRALGERLPLERVVEAHVFPPIRQGGAETGLAVIAAERLENRQTAAVGQRQIDQHEIGAIGARDRDRVGDGARDRHAATRLLEENAQGSAYEIVVLDDEHVRQLLIASDTGW